MELSWLREQTSIRASFCKNLHFKCRLNEDRCIVTSLNLCEFSRVDNNEMGIAIRREHEPELYRDAHEEAQRIIRISDEIRVSVEPIATPQDAGEEEIEHDAAKDDTDKAGSLTTFKLARKLGLKTTGLTERLLVSGHLELGSGKPCLTDNGKDAGGEFPTSPRFGGYFLWPQSLVA